MDKNIKNIVFDLGGVLINLDFERAFKAFKKAGFVDIESQLQSFSREGIFDQFELGEISEDEFRSAIKERANVMLTDQEIDDMWNLILMDIPREKLELILNLRGKYMVYLLSNTNKTHWDYTCQNAFNYHGFRVEDYFEETFLSFEMHLAKPDKAIFEKMLNDANLIAEETLFIDDSEANCRAAEELGIHAHHYHIGDDLKEIFE
ncbi:MAG: HAD family phosphatase [Bacteroidaceae bacterium]|nr:HAD family phosphatase [Bacteroidaceae bacterium]